MNVGRARQALRDLRRSCAAGPAFFGGGFHAGLDVAAETHFLRVDSTRSAVHSLVDFGARVSLVAGRRF